MRCLPLLLIGCAAQKTVTRCPSGSALGDDGLCYPSTPDPEGADGGGAEGGAADGGEAEDDEPPLPSLDAEAFTPAWDAAAVVAALDDALQHGLPMPPDLIEPYLEIMAQGDPFCPGHPDDLDGRWLLGCTAFSGSYYSGIAFWEQDTRAGHNEGISGDFRLRDRDGYTLEVGGAAGWDIAGLEDKPASAFAHGSVLWERDERWMGEVLSWSWESAMDREAREVNIRGSFGFRGFYLSFDEATLAAGCAGAAGRVLLRDPNGPWHTLDFGDACAPCAVHRYPGEPDGEVCYDLSPLVEPMIQRLEAE